MESWHMIEAEVFSFLSFSSLLFSLLILTCVGRRRLLALLRVASLSPSRPLSEQTVDAAPRSLLFYRLPRSVEVSACILVDHHWIGVLRSTRSTCVGVARSQPWPNGGGLTRDEPIEEEQDDPERRQRRTTAKISVGDSGRWQGGAKSYRLGARHASPRLCLVVFCFDGFSFLFSLSLSDALSLPHRATTTSGGRCEGKRHARPWKHGAASSRSRRGTWWT